MKGFVIIILSVLICTFYIGLDMVDALKCHRCSPSDKDKCNEAKEMKECEVTGDGVDAACFEAIHGKGMEHMERGCITKRLKLKEGQNKCCFGVGHRHEHGPGHGPHGHGHAHGHGHKHGHGSGPEHKDGQGTGPEHKDEHDNDHVQDHMHKCICTGDNCNSDTLKDIKEKMDGKGDWNMKIDECLDLGH